MTGSGGAAFSPEEIDKVKQRLEKLNENAANIMKLAQDADPDWKVWGLVGAIPAAFYWKFAAEDFYEHMQLMGEGLQDKVLRVDAAGKAYKATEDGIAEALQKLKGTLENAGGLGI